MDENNQVYESPDNRYIMEKADSKLVLSLDFHIPEGTKILGKYLFHQGCPKEIEIPVGVTTLEDEAIRGVVNSGIVIKIPNTVTKIGMRNFFPSDNYSIVGDIYYGGSEAEWNLIKMESGNYPKQFNIHFEKQTFTDGSGLEFILSSGTLTVQGKGALTRLPSNLVSIMGSQIKHIVIGEEITNVGSEVFRHCDDLDSVTFLGKDTKINSTAFKDTFLKDVYYPGDIYEWNALEVDRSDDSLKYAVIHFEEGEVRQLQVKDYSGEFKYVMTSGFEDGSGEGKYDYSLDFSDFSSSSTEFNQSLVKMSIRMAMAAMAKGDGTDHTYITDLFNSLRLKDARYSYTTPYKNSIGYAIGRKTLYGYRDDSELVVVAIRGGGYGNEWVGNVNVGNAGDHAGFDIAAQTVEKGLKDYLEEYIDKEGIDRTKVKIWISGYSRGAAVSNLLAAKLDRGEIEDLQKENIFAYCFECPRGTVAFKDVAWSDIYDNIFNFINPTDLVPNVAMNTGNWSFRRYGRDYYLPSAYSTWYTSFSLEKGLNVQKSMSHELILMRNQLSRIVYEKNNYSSMLDKYSNVGEIMRVWGLPTENDQPEINLRMMQRVTNLVTDRDMYYTHIQPLAEDLLINGLGNDILLNPQNVFNAFAILWVNAMKKQPDVFTRTMVLADRLALAYDLKNYKDDAIVAHYPEVNLAWIDSLYNESGYASRDDKYNRLYFNCPVDVEILDASGETVCLIKNDEVLGEGGVIARIDEDGQKVVILPADQEYTVKAVGNGEGTMTILNTICRMGEAIPDESEIYTELKVEKDMAYQATVSKNEILLENSEGQILEPDVTAKGDEVKYYQVELRSTHEDASYSGGGAYLAGEYARFEAGSDDVYSFLGWDIDGVRVSTDNVYRIPVTEDVTVTAVFEKIAGDPDKEGQPEKEKLPPITKAKGETIILGDSAEVKLSGVSPADITAKGNAGIYNDGFVTGVKKGKVKLYTTVMKKGKEKRVCICTIKVEDPKLKAEIKMKSQKKKKLKLSGTKKSAVWKCDDETVVKVDASTGELLAISPGGAMVTAVIPGYPFDHTYSCYVSVK
ncbi:MAG: leucine-rich repeat protein [Lachnospiraceae bacterium]|nr:leucine-rich repeat protein [Lachnospiraceae bacterium]